MATKDEKSITVPADLRALYEQHGQAQVFNFVDKLTADQAQSLFAQLNAIDPARVNKLYAASTATKASEAGSLEPVDPKNVLVLKDAESKSILKIQNWAEGGFQAIAQGKVGVIIMAGGQGTRLGSDRPKGEYNIGLPSGKSIFQLQAERLLTLERLANNRFKVDTARIMLYLMTSPMTHEPTVAYWKEKNYFGLKKEQVFCFQQGTLPCLTKDGKIILESSFKVAEAPDGNGGIYLGLHNGKAIQNMKDNGIESIYTGAIDNAVSKVGDPTFIGFCREMKADVGNKVCKKNDPFEKVGVQCTRGGVPVVVEYSDLDKKLAEMKDATGELKFRAGNVCMHYYSFQFLAETCHPDRLPSEYHVANKKIPYADAEGNTVPKKELTENTGIKLESFIFDIFSKSKNLVVFEVAREDEFSPVKNAPGNPVDSPDSARAIISVLHKRWLTQDNVTVQSSGPGHAAMCELSPLVCYAGEGLESLSGKTYKLPLLVQLASEPKPQSSKMKQVDSVTDASGRSLVVYGETQEGYGCEEVGCQIL